jgi:glycosyltransferase involved in cell wall biosynthesis
LVLRIGIDARAASEVPAGRGRFVRELLHSMAELDAPHRYELYARTAWDDGRLDDRFRWQLVDAADPRWNIRVGLTAHRSSDVFFSTNSYLTAWFTRVPTALNVFDMIAWEAPESAQRRAARIERRTLGRALRRAGHVFCNAEATRRDLLKRFEWASARTSVVPLAADDQFGEPISKAARDDVLRRLNLDRPFVLAIGTLEPRKNLGRLIDAFVALPDELRRKHLLALAGPRGWEDEEIHVKAGSERDSVRVLGHVTDDELVALYGSCAAFCYPSLYEGFGLPVLEAMRAGAPVVTSNLSSLPEVAGDAAEYVDPRDTAQITSAMELLLTDASRREELARQGRERAKTYSWRATASAILRQLEALGSRTRS